MDSTIKCPKCGEDIALSQAITHQIEDQVTATIKRQHEIELAQAKKEAAIGIEKAQKDLEASLAKKFQDDFERQIKQARQEAEENRKRNRELLDELSEMTKTMRLMKTEQDEAKLAMEKRLAQEQDKIRQEASKKAEEEQHLKLLELRKKMEDVEKANEELTRKLQQGSQQTQGEVLELELEHQLRKEFPNDIVSEVGKGMRGGDVIQEVIDRNGNSCGKVLWELKNTKAWSPQWVDKLKADQRAIKAETAIIVSEVLPGGINISGFHNGIWVTERNFTMCIAAALRANLIQLHYAKKANEGKNEKMEVLYNYLAGTEFRHRVEAIIEAFSAMQEGIEKEKRFMANKWAHDEKHIRLVIDNTYGMHGDLKAIVGGALTQIKGLDGPELLEADGKADLQPSLYESKN